MYFRKVTVDEVAYEVVGTGNRVEVKGVGKFKMAEHRFSAKSSEVEAFIRKGKKS